MNRSRSKTRKGQVGRPKRATRNQCPSYTDSESESANRSKRNPKKMRVGSPSPSNPSTSQDSQNGKSSAQPRHKNLTETRRHVMNNFIEIAQETPRKHGKVGSLQWMGKVLKTLNKNAEVAKDRVTKLDLLWWLSKHFEIEVEDMSRSMRNTRSQSREPAASSVGIVAQENGRSSRAGSLDEVSTDVVEPEVGNSRIVRKRKVKAATSQGATKKLPKNAAAIQKESANAPSEAVGNAQGESLNALEAAANIQVEAENASEAVGNVQGAVENPPGSEENAPEAAANLQGEAENAPEAVGNVQGAVENPPGSAAIVQGEAETVEAPAANVQAAAGSSGEAEALSPEVIDLDNDSNAGGSNETRHEDVVARNQSPLVVLQAGPGIRVAVEPPVRPGWLDAIFQERVADPEVGNKQQAEVNPEVKKLQMQMVALNLQINILQKDKRYSTAQIEVLAAQAKAMNAMINILSRV